MKIILLEILMNKIKYLSLAVISAFFALSMEPSHGKDTQFSLNIFNESKADIVGHKLQLVVGDISQPLYTQVIEVPDLPSKKSQCIPLVGFEAVVIPENHGQKTSISLLDSQGQHLATDYYDLQVNHLSQFPVLQIQLNTDHKNLSVGSVIDLARLAFLNAPQD